LYQYAQTVDVLEADVPMIDYDYSSVDCTSAVIILCTLSLDILLLLFTLSVSLLICPVTCLLVSELSIVRYLLHYRHAPIY